VTFQSINIITQRMAMQDSQKKVLAACEVFFNVCAPPLRALINIPSDLWQKEFDTEAFQQIKFIPKRSARQQKGSFAFSPHSRVKKPALT
jgi:hypothetical protein